MTESLEDDIIQALTAEGESLRKLARQSCDRETEQDYRSMATGIEWATAKIQQIVRDRAKECEGCGGEGIVEPDWGDPVLDVPHKCPKGCGGK